MQNTVVVAVIGRLVYFNPQEVSKYKDNKYVLCLTLSVLQVRVYLRSTWYLGHGMITTLYLKKTQKSQKSD